MSRRDDRVALGHMLDHAREAVALCHSKQREFLDTDRVTMLALTRLVEIVGEAANRVSAAIQASVTGVPWHEIVSMRNRLIPGYDRVDLTSCGR